MLLVEKSRPGEMLPPLDPELGGPGKNPSPAAESAQDRQGDARCETDCQNRQQRQGKWRSPPFIINDGVGEEIEKNRTAGGQKQGKIDTQNIKKADSQPGYQGRIEG